MPIALWRWFKLKKGKNIIIFLGSITLIFFFALYFGSYTGYYKTKTSNKATLTEEALERFEADVRSGKEIDAKNYLQEEKHYQNHASMIGMKISKVIEKIFNKGMNAIFNEIDKTIRS